MMVKKNFILIFLLVYSNLLFGQTPMLVPLDHNPALRHHKPVMRKSSAQVDTFMLSRNNPFIDDFSYYWDSSHHSQPDRRLWVDNYVYINNRYPVKPPSNGVATFDALDADGNVYQNSGATFPADTLTSVPIVFDRNALNNVYLSFFYQPQGHGDSPEPGDSLILQFKSPVTEKWRTVWGVPGTTLHPFKQVLVNVEEKGEEYLQKGKGFQFRFVNYVSYEQNPFNPGRKGNADHWHIDYVRLGSNRNENDTAIFDVAITEPLKTLVRGYQSIPWNQMPFAVVSRLEPTIEMTYRNNDIQDLPVLGRNFEIIHNHNIEKLSPGGERDIEAGKEMTYWQYILNPYGSSLVDSAFFEIKGYISTSPGDRKENDTVRFYQFFKDYFARDDGTPENGYGFSGYNAQGCAVACRYESFMGDSIRAINIYFNPTDNNVTAQYKFRIAVWRDDNGSPGEQVYLSSKEYSPKTTGQFTRFDLEKPVFVTSTRPYWIGWVQVTTGFLNVGFDRNYNDVGWVQDRDGSWTQDVNLRHLWYDDKTGRGWKKDTNDGTLMIRPVFGKRKDFPTSVEQPAKVADIRMKIYPNPATQQVRIAIEAVEAGASPISPFSPASPDYIIEIYDVSGRLRYRTQYTDNYIDVSGFDTGMYPVRLINRKTWQFQTDKLLIIR